MYLVPAGIPFRTLCFLCRWVEALGLAANETASFAIATSLFPNHVSTAIGALQSSLGVGFMMGPALGGALYEVIFNCLPACWLSCWVVGMFACLPACALACLSVWISDYQPFQYFQRRITLTKCVTEAVYQRFPHLQLISVLLCVLL